MMQTEEKRKMIIENLQRKVEKNGLEVTFSSPKITFFYLSKKALPVIGNDIPSSMTEPSPIPASDKTLVENNLENDFLGIEGPIVSDTEEASETGSVDYESLTPKEFKKLKKEKEREEKKFLQIRKDAHKRGYDTSVLRQFDDPEELYVMSDKEIDQLTAVGFVNEDGFYDFVYPPDADSLKRESISKKKILLILLILILGGAVVTFSIMRGLCSF